MFIKCVSLNLKFIELAASRSQYIYMYLKPNFIQLLLTYNHNLGGKKFYLHIKAKMIKCDVSIFIFIFIFMFICPFNLRNSIQNIKYKFIIYHIVMCLCTHTHFNEKANGTSDIE